MLSSQTFFLLLLRQMASQPQTWVLKVSVHCQGCKKKVKKILQTLPGVHEVDIEIKHQRVSVTGEVTPETLIKKLMKAGKHAVLWPENVERSLPNSNPPEETSTQEPAVTGTEVNPPVSKSENPDQDSTKGSQDNVAGGSVGGISGENGDGKVDEAGGEKEPETGSASNQATQPKAEETEKPTATDGGGVGGEGKKKKKKKKVQSTTDGGGGAQPTAVPVNQSPPRHYWNQYPPPPAAPVYGVIYNTAHPLVNSYTTSYYEAPPHSYSGPEMQSMHPPPPPPPRSDFEMFSEENPNGCSAM